MFTRQIHNYKQICADRETVLRLGWNNIIDRLDCNFMAGTQTMMMVNMTKYRLNNVVSWIIVACMISTLVLLLYWMFYPFYVMEIFETKIITPKVKSGNFLVYEMKYNKYIDIPGDIDRRLVNHITVPLVSHEGYRRTIGKNQSKIYVWIPKTVPSGYYKLHTTITYDVNPLRKAVISYETQQFEVLNGK